MIPTPLVPNGVNRRTFLSAGAMAPLLASSQTRATAADVPPINPRAPVAVDLSVNGRSVSLTLDNRTTLLDALR